MLVLEKIYQAHGGKKIFMDENEKKKLIEEEKEKTKGFWAARGADCSVGDVIIVTFFMTLILAVAVFVARVCVRFAFKPYFESDYKCKVEATLVEKTKDVKWRSVYDRKLDHKIREGLKAAKKDKEVKIYYHLKWEYEINGEKGCFWESDHLINFSKVGSKKKVTMFSDDGKKWYRSQIDAWLVVPFALSLLVSLLMVYCIFRLIVEKIKFSMKIKRKIGAASGV